MFHCYFESVLFLSPHERLQYVLFSLLSEDPLNKNNLDTKHFIIYLFIIYLIAGASSHIERNGFEAWQSSLMYGFGRF